MLLLIFIRNHLVLMILISEVSLSEQDGTEASTYLSHIDNEGKNIDVHLAAISYRNNFNGILVHVIEAKLVITSIIGKANMVDVGNKDITKRFARAVAIIDIGETAYKLDSDNKVG